MPCSSLTRRMMVKISFTRIGDRPSDGSSSSSSVGRFIKRAPDRQHLLLAARELAGRLVEPLLQPRKIAVDPLEILGDAIAIPRG